MFLRRTYITAWIVCLALVIGAPVARAADSTAFTIAGITEDVTAASATAAREQAFAQAQMNAFKKLCERLLPDEDAASLKLPEARVVAAFIRDFEITNEKVAPVRYAATYTFRFKPDSVRSWLSGQGKAFTDVSSKPVLILPFYQHGAQTALWSENNPWLAAWSRIESYQGLVPAIVPLGDAGDIAGIDDTQITTYDPQNLSDMVSRYDAGEAVITVAEASSDSAGAPESLSISIYRTDRGAAEITKTFTVAAQDVQGKESVFDAGVRMVRAALLKDWKTKTVVKSTEGNTLNVRVRFSSLKEWADTQQALSRVSGVNEVRLISLTPHEAQVTLLFSGGEDRLRLALAQADMTLSQPQVDFNAVLAYEQSTAGGSVLAYDLYLNRYRPAGTGY